MKFQIEAGKMIGYELEDNEYLINGYELTIPDGVTSIECILPYGIRTLNIPSAVISIDPMAFSSCNTITTVNISDPQSDRQRNYDCQDGFFVINDNELIRYIGNSEHIIIPDHIISIGSNAFSRCQTIKTVTIPDSVSHIGNSVFFECENLVHVTLPNNITEIKCCTFRECRNLETVDLPNRLQRIGFQAFLGCTKLTSITIPNGVETIEFSAFSNCTKLKSILIPNSVTYIGEDAFSQTEWRERYEGDFVIINGILIDYKATPNDYGVFTEIDIPKGIVAIGEGAFHNCESISTVNIPEGVKEIGDEAFAGCHNLTSINIPQGVCKIGQAAFQYCENLITIDIPDSVTVINNYAFANCPNVTTISIPRSVTHIGENAFMWTQWFEDYESDCEGNFVVINGILVAYKGECFDIDRIVIPENICDISNAVFIEYKNLSTVNIRGYDYKYNDTEIPIECFISFVLKEDYEASKIQPCDIILQMVFAGVESAVKYVKEHLDVFYDYADNLDDERLRKLVEGLQSDL